jgi:CheY-like chemotaxis protein
MSKPFAAPPARLLGWTVLVVDDEDDSRDVARIMLEMAGADVRLARTGLDALEIIRQSGVPDLILSDLSMPEMDGWDMIRALRADAALAHVPIIALTAHAMYGDRERVMAAGFIDHITKPISALKFVDQIIACLSPEPGK